MSKKSDDELRELRTLLETTRKNLEKFNEASELDPNVRKRLQKLYRPRIRGSTIELLRHFYANAEKVDVKTLTDPIERLGAIDDEMKKLAARFLEDRIKQTEKDAETKVAFATRPANFDFLIALGCDAKRAERCLQELDYRWDTVWSVKFPGWKARLVSSSNAFQMAIGGIGGRLMKVGVIAAVVKALKWVFGNVSF